MFRSTATPQVAAQLTPSDVATVAGAFVWAYGQLLGQAPPSANSWLYPLALSANETASWAQLYNWNVGNVTGTGYVGQIGYYRNPHVTTSLNFAAFANLGAGCLAELKILRSYGALAQADAGNYAGFSSALQSGGYAGKGVAYPNLQGLISKFSSVAPVPYAPGLSLPPVASLALGLGVVAASGYLALWLTTPPKRRWKLLPLPV